MLTGKARTAKIYQTNDGKRPFEIWLKGLKDVVGQARILARIERAESGNFGNYKDIRNGLYELKEPYGPGYRIYFSIDAEDIILLLIGGSKRSQKTDIEKARSYWEDYKQRQEHG